MTTANEYLNEINQLNTDVSNLLIKIKAIDKNSTRYVMKKGDIYKKFTQKFGKWTGNDYYEFNFPIITNLKNRIRSEKFNGSDKSELINEIDREILPQFRQFALIVINKA